jgi:hypothetical protein
MPQGEPEPGICALGFTSDRVYMGPLLRLIVDVEMLRSMDVPPLGSTVLSQHMPSRRAIQDQKHGSTDKTSTE